MNDHSNKALRPSDAVALEPLGNSIPPQLAAEIEAARSYRARSKAANTVRAYDSDWRQFEEWCWTRDLEPMPAMPEAVATYLASLAQAGRADSTRAAIDAMATATGTVTGLSTDPHQLHALLSVTAMAIPGSPIVLTGNATARAAAGPFASVTADFDHTATLSIEAPAGYVFTSQSGVLLTTPVPEPSSWWLLATGLIVLAAIRWRRQFRAWRDPGRPWVAMLRKHAGESESVRDRRYGKPIPGRLHPSCLVSKVTCLSEASTACERRSPRARSAARTAIAVLSSLVLVMPYALATTDNSLPLSQGTFACAGKAVSSETRVIETNEISYIDGGKAFCYGAGSSFGNDPFVNASATATGRSGDASR